MAISGQTAVDTRDSELRPHADRRSMPAFVHTGYRAVKSILHTLALTSAAALIIYLFLSYQQQQKEWLEFEAGTTGRTLTKHYAMIMAPALQQQEMPMLHQWLSILQAHPAIIEATLYDSRGVQLAPEQPYQSVIAKASGDDIAPVTHVENILNDSEQTIGYLRILVDPATILAPSLSFEHQRRQMVVAVAMLALLIGVYLARSFYKLRPVIRSRLTSRENHLPRLNNRR